MIYLDSTVTLVIIKVAESLKFKSELYRCSIIFISSKTAISRDVVGT